MRLARIFTFYILGKTKRGWDSGNTGKPNEQEK